MTQYKKMLKIKKSRLLLPKFFTYLALSLGAFIMGFPFFWMILGSLMGDKQIYKFPPDWIPRPALLSNFVEAFKFLTLRAFLNSFIFTAGVTIGIIFLSLLAAFAFAKLRMPGKNILFALYIGSLMIPWQVTLIPQFVIVSKLGWINTYQGLIIPFLANVSVGTFFFRQYFLSVPEGLYDAAKIDGCSIGGIFLRIYVPLARNIIAALAVITALNAWNMFIWPLVVVSKENMKVLTVTLSTLTSARINMPMGIVLASSFLSIIPILLIYIFAQKYFIEGIATTGLKY